MIVTTAKIVEIVELGFPQHQLHISAIGVEMWGWCWRFSNLLEIGGEVGGPGCDGPGRATSEPLHGVGDRSWHADILLPGLEEHISRSIGADRFPCGLLIQLLIAQWATASLSNELDLFAMRQGLRASQAIDLTGM